MAERLYSWPCDAVTENPVAAYYSVTQAQPQLPQPPPQPQLQVQAPLYPSVVAPAPLCADFNNNTNGGAGAIGGLRYFNALAGYAPPPGFLPVKYATQGPTMPAQLEVCQYAHANGSASCYHRNRFMPYNHNRACASAAAIAAVTGHPLMSQQHPGYQASFAPVYQQQQQQQQQAQQQQQTTPTASVPSNVSITSGGDFTFQLSQAPNVQPSSAGGNSTTNTESTVGGSTSAPTSDAITLQITNLDYSLDEASLRNFLMNQLKPITPVMSLTFEGSCYAKVTVPDLYFAKQVVSILHRKKIGHKRMLVSYTRDSSLTEVNTLRCQVAGLLKDVPYYTLPMYKFREVFQSRFKTSISVLDLYKMQDICTINSDNNEDKFISLKPELVNTLESSPLMEGLQHSVPYCTVHFKREQHKGWAEQETEPLPNVCMTIAEIQALIYPLLKHHPGDIPVATLLHCIEGLMKVQIATNETGVNLEHLVCCVQGVQIQVNNFGIKILGWLEMNKELATGSGGFFTTVADPLFRISREVIELVKMSPKSTMKFNRFIPAYHNHFGKQCRVADYGYTKLIELFEALSSVVQIMGEGENRQITLTHRTQIRRFTSDLLRILRAQENNSVLLSQLPTIFAQTHNRNFDVTDYGVCDIVDILDGLVNCSTVILSTVQQGKDILISMPKRKPTNCELEKICVFAGEMVELFQNALQYSIQFKIFARSYHYHFAYQCRVSDYGFIKLADLMDAIHGVVEVEQSCDEDKKIMLAPKVARRIFAEQCEDLIRNVTGNSFNCMKLEQILRLHKKKYGYQMLPQTLGAKDIPSAVALLPYVEVLHKEQAIWLICHNDDLEFRQLCYRACKQLMQREGNQEPLTQEQFLSDFNVKHQRQLTESSLLAMRHAIEIYQEADQACVRLTSFMRFLISLVNLLEQRPSMYLYELKTALDCGLATTFEFGYPNLYSVIVAHDDLFTINVGHTQERSEIALNVHCELRLTAGASHRHLFGSLKLPYAKHKAQRSSRTPLGDHNRPPPALAPPPPKTRAISSEYSGTANASNATFKPQVKVSSMQASFQEPLAAAATSASIAPPTAENRSVLSSTLLNSSGFGSGSGSGSGSNTSSANWSLWGSSSNKENSLNSSQQMFNSSSSSSSNSPLNTSGELNSSLYVSDVASSTPITSGTAVNQSSNLWYRRQASFYQQQQQHQASLRQQKKSMNTGRDYYDLSNCGMGLINSFYEPPKPDTPPTKKLPFCFDPIWSNASQQSKTNILGIRLPELKTLLTPYTISKYTNMNQPLFSFDSHESKIAHENRKTFMNIFNS